MDSGWTSLCVSIYVPLVQIDSPSLAPTIARSTGSSSSPSCVPLQSTTNGSMADLRSASCESHLSTSTTADSSSPPEIVPLF